MSQINRSQWLLDRRHCLKGLGATIALPFLNCMQPASATGTKKQFPKRSVFIYIPNGVNTLTWQIQKAGKDYELTESLKSLEKHRGQITPVSGLHHPDVLGKHHNCDKVWLTGADVPADGGAFETRSQRTN